MMNHSRKTGVALAMAVGFWLLCVMGASVLESTSSTTASYAKCSQSINQLAIRWIPRGRELQEIRRLDKLRQDEAEGANKKPDRLQKTRYPPPNFTPGTNDFDYLWGSPDWPKGKNDKK